MKRPWVVYKPVVERLAPDLRISDQEKELLGATVTTEDGTGQVWSRAPGPWWWIVREDGTTFLTSTDALVNARSQKEVAA